jgi:hypothetical protein
MNATQACKAGPHRLEECVVQVLVVLLLFELQLLVLCVNLLRRTPHQWQRSQLAATTPTYRS